MRDDEAISLPVPLDYPSMGQFWHAGIVSTSLSHKDNHQVCHPRMQ